MAYSPKLGDVRSRNSRGNQTNHHRKSVFDVVSGEESTSFVPKSNLGRDLLSGRTGSIRWVFDLPE